MHVRFSLGLYVSDRIQLTTAPQLWISWWLLWIISWRSVCVLCGCIMSNEDNIGELQPQHSSATERIHHPGQRWNSGAADAHAGYGPTDSTHAGTHNKQACLYATPYLLSQGHCNQSFCAKAGWSKFTWHRMTLCIPPSVLNCPTAATDGEQVTALWPTPSD